MPTVQELQTAQMQKVSADREASIRNNPWAPQRPARPMIWVRPAPQFPRVLDGAGGFITGPAEVDAGDAFIQRRIKDGELQVLSSEELQQVLAPPAPEPEVQEEAPPPAPPETFEAAPVDSFKSGFTSKVDSSPSSEGSF